MRLFSIAGFVLTSLLFASVLSGQPTPAPGPPAMPSVALPPELDRVLRDYERAWQGRDATALANLFTEDGFVLSNGKPPVRGRAAIREAYARSGGPLALRALAFSTDGKVGYVIGAFGGKPGDPDSGKFVLVLRRGDDGRWLIAADMDNGNSRPGPGPGPPRTPTPATSHAH